MRKNYLFIYDPGEREESPVGVCPECESRKLIPSCEAMKAVLAKGKTVVKVDCSRRGCNGKLDWSLRETKPMFPGCKKVILSFDPAPYFKMIRNNICSQKKGRAA